MGYLSDVARRRIAALLLLAGLAVAVLAVTDTGTFSDPPTEEERVQTAAERFYEAAAEGDFETYCSLLTESARSRVQENAARLLEQAGELPCVEIVAIAEETYADAELRVHEVSVSGPSARVEADLKPQGGPVESLTIILEEQEDTWLVSDPGL